MNLSNIKKIFSKKDLFCTHSNNGTKYDILKNKEKKYIPSSKAIQRLRLVELNCAFIHIKEQIVYKHDISCENLNKFYDRIISLIKLKLECFCNYLISRILISFYPINNNILNVKIYVSFKTNIFKDIFIDEKGYNMLIYGKSLYESRGDIRFHYGYSIINNLKEIYNIKIREDLLFKIIFFVHNNAIK